MIEGKYLLFSDDFTDIFAVRKQCEEYKGSSFVKDDLDDEAVHVIAYEDGIPIGTGRLLMHSNSFEVDKICVIPQKRNQKIGDFIMRLLIEKANTFSARSIYCILTNPSCESFFELFGFEKEHEENKNDDRTMVLNLEQYYTNKKCCRDK